MRSERFVPVSDILPRISATVIVLNYNAMLSAEQLSVMFRGQVVLVEDCFDWLHDIIQFTEVTTPLAVWRVLGRFR